MREEALKKEIRKAIWDMRNQWQTLKINPKAFYNYININKYQGKVEPIWGDKHNPCMDTFHETRDGEFRGVVKD